MMNKQKTNKVWRWKVATFLPVLALLLLTFCKPVEKDLVGTWKLVSCQYGTGEKTALPDTVNAIKLITPGHFTWLNYKTKDKIVCDLAGGTYVFDGENYTENVEYGAQGMFPYFWKSNFKIKIEGDQMFLSGSRSDGLKLEEVWKKL